MFLHHLWTRSISNDDDDALAIRIIFSNQGIHIDEDEKKNNNENGYENNNDERTGICEMKRIAINKKWKTINNNTIHILIYIYLTRR